MNPNWSKDRILRFYLKNPELAKKVSRRELYRMWFLKSDEWKEKRLKVLEQNNCACFICRSQSASNDIHHVNYPKNWFRFGPSMFVLCRRCHDAVHVVMDAEKFETKSNRIKRFKELAGIMRSNLKRDRKKMELDIPPC